MINIDKLWYGKHVLAYLLLPFSFLYRTAIFIRKKCYEYGLFKVSKLPVPVIVVGNITVGGTGKTPVVIAMVQWLHQQGFKPGVISRGYAAKAPAYPCHVELGSDPSEVGDEPLLIKRHTDSPVVVDPKRVRAAQELVAIGCNVIVSDDGLQHYALARDIEIVLVDHQKRQGNSFCLPAGPLREPISRLQTVDLVMTSEQDYQRQQGDFFEVDTNKRVELMPQKIHAVAGIASPHAFFAQLTKLGFDIISHNFPDHYQYAKSDLEFVESLPIVMTEKDAVKCTRLPLDQAYYQQLSVSFSPEVVKSFVGLLSRFKS